MKRFLKIVSVALLAFTLQFGSITEMDAQCPMCRMSAESNLENGGTAGKGLNVGIMYMLGMPYLIAGVIGYNWWINRRKEDELEMEEM